MPNTYACKLVSNPNVPIFLPGFALQCFSFFLEIPINFIIMLLIFLNYACYFSDYANDKFISFLTAYTAHSYPY